MANEAEGTVKAAVTPAEGRRKRRRLRSQPSTCLTKPTASCSSLRCIRRAERQLERAYKEQRRRLRRRMRLLWSTRDARTRMHCHRRKSYESLRRTPKGDGGWPRKARQAYEDSAAQLRKAYDEAAVQAKKEFDETVATAMKARVEARVQRESPW